VKIDPGQGSYTPWWKGLRITVFRWDADGASVAREGKPISGAKVDREHHSVTVEIDDDAKGGTFSFSATK